jgi:ubiquinone/menaquinone biosynthesis C-methylase UbiE
MISRCIARSFETHILKSGSSNLKEDIHSLEQYWEKAMDWYSIYNSRLSLKIYKTITPFLNLKEAKKILEIGGGTGLGAEVLIKNLSPSATYTLTDYIECFLKVAKSKNLYNTDIIHAIPSELPFNSDTFDRFIALATIEELETTKKILTEAYRVLQPGGIIAASVSGKREADNYRLICEKVRHKFDIKSPLKFRSDLKNSGIVKQMFIQAGFSKVFGFHENIHFGSTSVPELKKFFMLEPSIAEQPSETLKQIDQFLENEINYLLKVQEEPLGTDFLIVIGYKLL